MPQNPILITRSPKYQGLKFALFVGPSLAALAFGLPGSRFGFCCGLRRGGFRKLGVPYFGVLIIGILLFSVLY